MQEIAAIGDYASPRRDVLSVLWAITKACQFRCSYCVYHKPPAGAEYSARADLLRAARTLVRLGRPGYQITLYGGEPTLHPHFEDLLAYLVAAPAPIELRMYTNGARSPAFFARLADMTRGFDFRIIFSLHLEYANFAKFKQALAATAGAGMSAGVSFMLSAGHKERGRAWMAELLELRRRHPFFAYINYPYTGEGALGTGFAPDDIAWVEESRRAFALLPMPAGLRTPFYTRIVSDVSVRQHGLRTDLPARDSLRLLARMNTPSYQGYACCSGANVFFVEEDGAVRGGVCDRSAPLGNLFTDSELHLVQNTRVVRCTAPACNSIENIPLPKFLDAEEAEACMTAFRDRARRMVLFAEATRLRPAWTAREGAPA